MVLTLVLSLFHCAQQAPPIRFALPQRYAVGTTPRDLAVADVNGDGHPDVLTANWDKSRSSSGGGDNHAIGVGALLPNLKRRVKDTDVGSVSILPGQPDGRLGRRRDVPVHRFPDALAVADLDGDGRPDVAVSGMPVPYVTADGPVLVLLNQGTAGWRPVPLPADSGVAIVNDLAAADLDGDGRAEVLVSLRGGNGGQLGYWAATAAAGQFRPRRRLQFAPPHYDPQRVLLADVTGDGYPDAVVANNASFRQDSALLVLPGRAGGRFGVPQAYVAEWGPVAVGDLNGDGYPEVVSVSAQYLRVWPGTAHGLGAPQRPAQPGPAPLSVLLADLNGDGRPDLITNHYTYNYPTRTPGAVLVRPGLPGGGFGPPTVLRLGFDAGSRLAVADLNADGRPDLVALAPNHSVLVLLNETGK